LVYAVSARTVLEVSETKRREAFMPTKQEVRAAFAELAEQLAQMGADAEVPAPREPEPLATPVAGKPEVDSRSDVTGLPRPSVAMALDKGGEKVVRRLPAPWINGQHALKGDFYSFRDDVRRAETERLCCICGDPLRDLVAIAAFGGGLETSGGWGHPRCVNMAVVMCPHFTNERALTWSTVAWLYDGPGVGCSSPMFEDIDEIDLPVTGMSRETLKDLAKDNPWGEK
jgi:hypothetical protein